jgi:hypothetical protein
LKNQQREQGKKDGRQRCYDHLCGINESHIGQIRHQKASRMNKAKKIEDKGAVIVSVELTNCIQDKSVIEKPAA